MPEVFLRQVDYETEAKKGNIYLSVNEIISYLLLLFFYFLDQTLHCPVDKQKYSHKKY